MIFTIFHVDFDEKSRHSQITLFSHLKLFGTTLHLLLHNIMFYSQRKKCQLYYFKLCRWIAISDNKNAYSGNVSFGECDIQYIQQQLKCAGGY